MNIAVNTRFLLHNKLEGIGWFTNETLKRITRNHPEHQFYFFFDRSFSEEFIFSTNVQPVVLHPQARHPVLYYLWFEYSVPRALRQVDADLFISTDGFLSLKTDVKTLLVIHDIAFEHFPANIDLVNRWYYQYFSPKYAHRANRIATVSEFSKQDIIKTYGIAPTKIDVVHNGSKENYRHYAADDASPVLEKFGISGKYFIYAGAIQPRKNIVNLLLAFDRFKEKNRGDAQLVLAGRKAWKFDDVLRTYEQLKFKNAVVLTGHLSTDELGKLMSRSLAMTYVSRFEGFGIPIIEAMNSGTAVITSNVSSMPEVAGDAALLVNPDSVSDIAEAMERIYKDENLRKSLIEKGNLQRQKFSWDRTAELLWQSAEKIIQTN